MSDLFVSQGISPMLLKESKPFNSKDYIFELKLDGFRCIAYLDEDSTILKSRNNKDFSATFPELANLHKCVKKRCILDGEIVCLKGGKPNFFALQKRSRIKKANKIEGEVSQNSVQFVAFDILFLGEEDLTKIPQIKRKVILAKTVKEGFNLSISRYVEEIGVELFSVIKAQKLEGIVAKRKQGFYYLGKRTGEWLKIKAILEEDFVICGYVCGELGKIKSVILGRFDKGGKLHFAGKANLANPHDKKIVEQFANNNAQNAPWFVNFKSVVWLKPNLIATVCYLEKTSTGNLRHPIIKEIKQNS